MNMDKRPDVILFDWDNTLIDSWAIIHEVMNVTLETFGHAPWSLPETRNRVARSMRDSFPDLFGDDWEKAGEVFYSHFETIHLEKLAPLPGAEDMLSGLFDAGLPMGVVSNKRGDILRRESTHLGWDRFFGQVIGAGDAAHDKPSADPIYLALGQNEVPAGAEVWYVGDGLIDMKTAAAAGCVGVLLRPDPPEVGEFRGSPPVRHAPDCKALFNIVQNL